MILLAMVVRDEADIIGLNLEHHLAAGVDRVVVLDNGSTDGTADILDAYVRAGVAEVTRDDPADFQLAVALDALVRDAAARLRPEWVAAPDADEFLVTPGGDLRAALAAHGADRVLRCERDNMIGSLEALEEAGWQQALVHLCTQALLPPGGHADPLVPLALPWFAFRLPPKVIFRPQGLRGLAAGSHAVALDPAAEPVPTAIRMRHFPMRSAAEFLRSVRRYAAILSPDLPGRPQPSGKYRRWRAMLAQGAPESAVLAEALPDAAALAKGLADGSYLAAGAGIDWPRLAASAASRHGSPLLRSTKPQVCDH
ncbi:glycosyltransferase family 2 protein [Paracoccus sp. (in: a-proteobacteria)]